MGTPKVINDDTVFEWRAVVGEMIRAARMSAKLTQADAAFWLKWSRTTIVAIEKGDQSVSLDQLLRLAALYDVHVADLLPGEVQRNGRQRY